MAHRRQYAAGQGNKHRQRDGQPRKHKRCRQFSQESREHIFPRDEANPHIPMQNGPKPVYILLAKGQIKPQSRLALVNDLLRHFHAAIAVHFRHGITARHIHQQKR